MKNNYFKLFANCIPVMGSERSIICDLQRFNFVFIPNILFEILTEHSEKNILDIKFFYENGYDKIIDDYFKYLFENELGFYTSEPYLFPKLDETWKTPSVINNAIIDIDNDLSFNFINIKNELDKFNCKGLELRFYSICSIDYLNKILNYFKDSRLQHILVYFKYSSEINEKDYKKLLINNKKVIGIILHSSYKSTNLETIDTEIIHTLQTINSENHCGLVQTNYFSINIDTFFESKKHNNCLNKKLAIDKDGNIKNCPSMQESYGNIKDTTIEQALNHPNFKKYWNITKDQIEVCKDCEFRHICTDCRAYIEEPENQYSKPLKCGYNPYTNEWSKWSTNPLKQKAIEFYGMKDLVKKDE